MEKLKTYQKWRINNKERYLNYQREYQYDNYERYKEKTLLRKKHNYLIKKEFLRLSNMLLD